MYNKSRFIGAPNHFAHLLDGLLSSETDHAESNKPSRSASVNIKETPDRYEVQLVAPGLNKQDFKIAVDKNILTVSFEHKEEQKESTEKWLRQEFKMQSFARSFTLSEGIESNRIQAQYENGILNVLLPKKEKTEAKAIEIAVQ